MINATVAFLVLGSRNILSALYDVIPLTIVTVLVINHLFLSSPTVSQPRSSQEVQIRQVAILIVRQRPETRVVAVAVEVCTQGLYVWNAQGV